MAFKVILLLSCSWPTLFCSDGKSIQVLDVLLFIDIFQIICAWHFSLISVKEGLRALGKRLFCWLINIKLIAYKQNTNLVFLISCCWCECCYFLLLAAAYLLCRTWVLFRAGNSIFSAETPFSPKFISNKVLKSNMINRYNWEVCWGVETSFNSSFIWTLYLAVHYPLSQGWDGIQNTTIISLAGVCKRRIKIDFNVVLK